MLTHARLLAALAYDPTTGEFRWRLDQRRARAGALAGCIDKSSGYVRIQIDRRYYYAHRLAWFYVHGEWPAGEVDHREHSRADNRIAMLRPATRVQNGSNLPRKRNNTSGVPGVSWSARDKRWCAYINPNGRKVNLGSHVDFLDAVSARKRAEAQHFGEFASAA